MCSKLTVLRLWFVKLGISIIDIDFCIYIYIYVKKSDVLIFQMQDCGQPPKDLVGDLGSMVTFDEDGNPCLPGLAPGMTDPSQCSVM